MNKLQITPIPAIDLIEGKCVRLTQGDYATSHVYAEDPVDMARRFEDMGFTRLHLVDLDGAKSRHVVNDHILKAITRATKLIVDFGGGVKTDDDMARVLDAGAEMVTCGSIAVTQPDTVLGWMERYGAEHLILGADAKDGKISINGWQEDSAYELMPFLQRYLDAGMMHVLCTDISRDGMLQGPATALYSSIMQAFPHCRLIASGGVSCIEDILQLDKAGVPAVVFGKAIYEGKINMKELAEMAF
ncbi:MAG: 1-(5-phosphoribosyl)-5-[(5-phosphoribosylamino)methylideneamino]imidazole-4-carboxamide isomerase [Bacteroidaceae bacterium]|nr:1-(5-phosphoribosyl)-5-[(5-phosphoribosylamino)methylideneamino]imidazole-4-carboxamide isomerase [Bacteroidaceae bacterium]